MFRWVPDELLVALPSATGRCGEEIGHQRAERCRNHVRFRAEASRVDRHLDAGSFRCTEQASELGPRLDGDCLADPVVREPREARREGRGVGGLQETQDIERVLVTESAGSGALSDLRTATDRSKSDHCLFLVGDSPPYRPGDDHGSPKGKGF